jgi:hypothetical protein
MFNFGTRFLMRQGRSKSNLSGLNMEAEQYVLASILIQSKDSAILRLR